MPGHLHRAKDALGVRHEYRVATIDTGQPCDSLGRTIGVVRVGLRRRAAMVNEALSGTLDNVETIEDPIFGLHIPISVPNVPDEVLNPRNTWSDKAGYDKQAQELAAKFNENFKKYAEGTAEAICKAGPKG